MFWAEGMVLWPFVLMKPRTPSDILFKHEFIHCYQVKEKGILKFYVSYIWTILKTGYKKHPMEIDAYAREREPLTTEEARWILEGKVNIV